MSIPSRAVAQNLTSEGTNARPSLDRRNAWILKLAVLLLRPPNKPVIGLL